MTQYDTFGNDIAVSGLSPVPQVSSLPTISSTSLASTPTLTPTQPQSQPIYPVAGLQSSLDTSTSPDLTLTPSETQAQDINTRIQQLNDQLIGRTAYTAEQETAQGIPDLMKSQTDLSSRLKGLQNEALAIPLQLQQDATGRGVTAGGLQPIQTAALRNNAIQALSVNSLLEASRGNLTTALSMVDRAVQQHFGPIEEEISAKMKNLQLILNSPQYALEDKNRAQKQLEIQQKKAEALAQQKQTFQQVQDIAVKAASLGADPVVLHAIQNAHSLLEATQIAQQYGVLNAPAAADYQTVRLDNGETIVFDKTTGKKIRSLGGAQPISGGTGTGTGGTGTTGTTTLTPEQLQRTNEALSLAQQLRDDNAVGKHSAVGASFAKIALGAQQLGLQPSRTAFEAKVNTLKANLTLDNLKLLKGAMSDKDLLFLNSVGSSLDTNMSEEQFNIELDRIIAKLKTATSGGTGGGRIVTAPDGTQIEIIDDQFSTPNANNIQTSAGLFGY